MLEKTHQNSRRSFYINDIHFPLAFSLAPWSEKPCTSVTSHTKKPIKRFLLSVPTQPVMCPKLWYKHKNFKLAFSFPDKKAQMDKEGIFCSAALQASTAYVFLNTLTTYSSPSLAKLAVTALKN
ncbi:hypothetical protein BaRGS_00025102 [Batillaria attramentaria]|uniref:Uncharacterized protein n=1 Tax=Batillaria attramentaria TaxID=370345 RepID=A0ABD0K979_9CAEN